VTNMALLQSDDRTVFRLAIEPRGAEGAVMIVHGYLATLGGISRLINWWTRKRFAVYVVSHCTKGEKPGQVEFDTVVDRQVKLWGRRMAKYDTRILVGHSMGGLVALHTRRAIEEGGLPPPTSTVLMCPLIAFKAKFLAIVHPILPYLPSIPRNIVPETLSSDPEYLDIVKSQDNSWVCPTTLLTAAAKVHEGTAADMVREGDVVVCAANDAFVCVPDEITDLTIHAGHEFFNEEEQVANAALDAVWAYVSASMDDV
jgi:alpha-beta hydrolase superfamily lysophospholipase